MTTYKSIKYNISGADLTAIPTSAITTGTMADARISASSVTQHASTFDDNKIQTNIALLGFKTAVNGSLAKYNLVDQIVDEYTDATGVDASASTNENLSSGVYNGGVAATITQDADSTAVDGDYTYYKWTDTGSTGSYATTATQAHEVLVIAGGGSAGGSRSGGGSGAGGAGGYRTASALSLVGSTSYTITVGAGGPATSTGTSVPGVTGSVSSISGSDITDIQSAGGGGGGHASGGSGLAGGSGGGGGGNGGVTGASGGAGNTPSTSPVQGYAGGNVTDANGYGAGGGGSGGAAPNGGSSPSTAGIGTANDITGASVTYAAGGSAGNNNPGADGTVNTGNGGQGGGQAYGGGAGGSGIVILRRLTSSVAGGANLTLQSNDTTASTANPDYADMIVLMENASGTATLNTDIKGYISEDSGVTFTQGTLVDEGTWGTNKKIIAFHDLDISAQTGSAMCYKITTHNQSAGSKETKIHATSIGWR
jgi:hypothetical protein